MDQSSSIAKLSDVLAKAQASLKNPHFDSTNPHFKSKFASLGAVREAVIPVFSGLGIAVTQWPLSADGAAGCRTVVSHAGEWMAQDFLIPVDKQNAHGYASAVTYAKRISLQSIACVVGDVDDDGNQAVGDNVNGIGKGPKHSPRQGFFDSLAIDVQNSILECSHRVSKLLKAGDIPGAYDELAAYDCEGYEDRKAGLWDQFDSKERAALTKEGQRRREGQTERKAA